MQPARSRAKFDIAGSAVNLFRAIPEAGAAEDAFFAIELRNAAVIAAR